MRLHYLKRLCLLLCAVVLTASVCLPVHAAYEPVTIYLNGENLVCSDSSFIDNGTTYVPLAAFARQMEPCEVTWDGVAAHVTSDKLILRAAPGNQFLEANGKYFYVPGAVQLISGRTMVPLNVLSKVYNLNLTWNAATKSVTVLKNHETPPISGSESYNEDALYWLSRIISSESRGEPLAGQIAVGNVVLNRVHSDVFPNTITEVIFQERQFEPVSNGTIYNEPSQLSVIAAKLCLDGTCTVGDSMFFFAPALSPGTWIVNHRTYFTTIGSHEFYL